ncbi:unnamed protein product [Malus baccata var. baccata]
MSKNFKSESDNFGKMQMSCDWEVVDVKFTSQDGCNNGFFSLKALLAELSGSVTEALHDESDIGLIHYSHSFLLLILIVYDKLDIGNLLLNFILIICENFVLFCRQLLLPTNFK